MSHPCSWTAGLGRALLSLIFIMSGVHKLTAWNETTGMMTSEGMQMAPFFLAGAVAFELLGGLSVLLGIKARMGAAALFLFLIPTTLIFHDFWTYAGTKQQMEMINFMKNLAIMGGLLMIVSLGPGRCCVLDNRQPGDDSSAGGLGDKV
jgi:putative oxidoreductase